VRTGAHRTKSHWVWVVAWARVVHGCARPPNAERCELITLYYCISWWSFGRPPCALTQAGALPFIERRLSAAPGHVKFRLYNKISFIIIIAELNYYCYIVDGFYTLII